MGCCFSCCRGCKRCCRFCGKCCSTCFRPKEEEIVEELCELGARNAHFEIGQLHGRCRLRFGDEEFETGRLCSTIPEGGHRGRLVSPIHLAALGDHLETILVMLKLPGCEPNAREEPCQLTPLHMASRDASGAPFTCAMARNLVALPVQVVEAREHLPRNVRELTLVRKPACGRVLFDEVFDRSAVHHL